MSRPAIGSAHTSSVASRPAVARPRIVGVLGERCVKLPLGRLVVLMHHRLEEAMLIGEVVIDSAFGDAGRIGDLRDRRIDETVLGERLCGGQATQPASARRTQHDDS